jgi:hypothetical protein
MITIETLTQFQKINTDHDIMGVVRTLFPDNEIVFKIDKTKEKGDEVQD